MSYNNVAQTHIEQPQGGNTMADIHICGQCRSQFTCIDKFISHKRAGCTPVTHPPPAAAASQSSMLNTPTTTAGSTRPSSSQAPVNVSTAASSVGSSKKGWHDTTKGPVVNPPESATDSTPGGVASSSGVTTQDKNTSDGNKTPVTKAVYSSPHQPTKSKTEKRYKCTNDGCSFTTAHLKDIQRHVRIHTGEKPYECSYCKKRFTRQDKLKIHLRIHTGDKPFQCSVCEYRSIDGGSMKKHMRIHNDERPFKCQICDYRSRNSSQLIVHLRTHTGDTPFHCQKCDMKFKINSDLTRHTMVHTGEKPFKCTECEYRSTLKSNLKLHIKTNHKNENRYQCEECGYGCCTKRQLKIHSHTHATTDPIKCLECSFTCFNKAVFRRHEGKHTDSSHKCGYCDFVSTHAGQVPKHVRKHHPEMVVKVPTKRRQKRQKHKHKKSSSRKSDTWPVIKIHTKKPFTCDSCEANFMRQDSLMSHRRQHERLNAKNEEEQNRESMAYAVLQLQYTGKDTADTNPNLNESILTPTTEGVAGGMAQDKPANDELNTLLSAIEARQNSEDSMAFSTEALSEVHGASSDNRQDARELEHNTNKAPLPTGSSTEQDLQIVTVEFPQQDIVNTSAPQQMPASTYPSSTTPNAQAPMSVTVCHSVTEDTSTISTGNHYKKHDTAIFELQQQQLQVGNSSGGQHIQQTVNIPTQYMSQQMQSGQILPMQPQTVQLSSTTQLQVLQPAQTITNVAPTLVTNAAPKLMNFATVQTQPHAILIPHQQMSQQQQHQQQQHVNTSMQQQAMTTTNTMHSGHSQSNWQPIQQHMQQMAAVGQPVQQVYRPPQIMTLAALPQQHPQYIPIRPTPDMYPTSSSGQSKSVPKQ